MVNRSSVSPTDIGEETIIITFGEYPLAPVRVKIDEEEYCVKATNVQDHAEEILLGRDVQLHKHILENR